MLHFCCFLKVKLETASSLFYKTSKHCGSSPRSLAALCPASLSRFVADTSHTTCPNSCLLISSHPSTGTGWHYPFHCSSQCLSSNLSQASHSLPWYGPSHSAVSLPPISRLERDFLNTKNWTRSSLWAHRTHCCGLTPKPCPFLQPLPWTYLRALAWP